MTVIRQEDLIQSVADALQYISYFHPRDFIQAIHEAYLIEESESAKDAMAQILVNSRMCAMDHRPICQDTGIVTALVKVGMGVQWQGNMAVTDMINEGVRRAYLLPENILRPSILRDPDGARINTGDNTPAVIHYEIVEGDSLEIYLAAKGGGSEAKARFAMLNPSDSIVDWIVDQIPGMGAGWCPPGILGVGVGGTAEKAMLMAKEALFESIDIQQLRARGPANRQEELRIELMSAVNNLGIGAQGLGGLTTVLDVKVKEYPSHAANKAVAIIPNCAATRHIHFTMDGVGPAIFSPPDMDDWPDISWQVGEQVRRINLDEITPEVIGDWRPGETLLLSGKLLTGRDAAHKKIVDLLDENKQLPVDFSNRFIYYVGPVDPVRDEIVGPAGPTTATRMDKFTRALIEQTGLIGMIGKAERGPVAINAIRDNGAVYLMAVGGAAYLVSKAITAAKIVAFPELGMEAIYEFEVVDMPVTVAVDSEGNSVHRSGPREWQAIIEERAIELGQK
jgi:fumarate hydratase class I